VEYDSFNVIVGLDPTIQIDLYVWIPAFTGMTWGKSLLTSLSRKGGNTERGGHGTPCPYAGFPLAFTLSPPEADECAGMTMTLAKSLLISPSAGSGQALYKRERHISPRSFRQRRTSGRLQNDNGD